MHFSIRFRNGRKSIVYNEAFVLSWCESLWLDPDRDASGRLITEDEEDEDEENEEEDDDFGD